MRVQPSDYGLYENMRVNPITGQRNPGFWEYHTERYLHYDCGPAFSELYRFLSTNIDSLLRIKEVYQCEIILRIMIYIKDEMDHPGITIETSFMELASRLDARIDIDINWY